MSHAMNLARELASLGANVTRLATDSREIAPGDTFVAYPGEKSDGRRFIAQAIAKGANAVIWDAHSHTWDAKLDIPNLGLTDLRNKAGWLADTVYGAPSERLWMIGVTGTNGKTSTCHWIAHALNETGKKCALIGTLGNGFAGELQQSANTTPDAIRVHSLLAAYLQQGAAAVAMEVSSHALSQGRVNGVRFDVALLTNLSRDHLDYHGDMAQYAAAKRRLFDWQSLRYAVVNLDDEFGRELALQLADSEVEVIGYGLTDAALYQAERHGIRMVFGKLQQMNAQGIRLEIYSSWGKGELGSELIGRFNAANLLGTLAVLLASDVQLADALQSLATAKAVAGRMQRLENRKGPATIVDYAHTPDALEKVLMTLREVGEGLNGRLICVFGCGGDRDRGKRAMMGRVAERYSDICIVTSDNPRSEEPQRIIDDVVGEMTLGNHEIIVDRAAAIARAMQIATAGDIVLLAGKGHENYQEIGNVKYPFSDAEVAMQALKSWQADTSGGVQ